MGGASGSVGELCWTRALELRLVSLVREREVLWRPRDNTNYNIHLKYKAYAELARLLHPRATARAVRDRWVNIRSTYNHNVRKVTRSMKSAHVYVPSWPLWTACQFLGLRHPQTQELPPVEAVCKVEVDEHAPTTRARRPRSHAPPVRRPRLSAEFRPARKQSSSSDICRNVLYELVQAVRPLAGATGVGIGGGSNQQYRWLGLHVAERLSSMRPADGAHAATLITNLLRATSYTQRIAPVKENILSKPVYSSTKNIDIRLVIVEVYDYHVSYHWERPVLRSGTLKRTLRIELA